MVFVERYLSRVGFDGFFWSEISGFLIGFSSFILLLFCYLVRVFDMDGMTAFLSPMTGFSVIFPWKGNCWVFGLSRKLILFMLALNPEMFNQLRIIVASAKHCRCFYGFHSYISNS